MLFVSSFCTKTSVSAYCKLKTTDTQCRHVASDIQGHVVSSYMSTLPSQQRHTLSASLPSKYDSLPLFSSTLIPLHPPETQTHKVMPREARHLGPFLLLLTFTFPPTSSLWELPLYRMV